jgi:hypothetical protein
LRVRASPESHSVGLWISETPGNENVDSREAKGSVQGMARSAILPFALAAALLAPSLANGQAAAVELQGTVEPSGNGQGSNAATKPSQVGSPPVQPVGATAPGTVRAVLECRIIDSRAAPPWMPPEFASLDHLQGCGPHPVHQRAGYLPI